MTPNTEGYYLKYDSNMLGPIAPDNPEWDFLDPRMVFKCQKFVKETNKKFGTDYEVIRVDS